MLGRGIIWPIMIGVGVYGAISAAASWWFFIDHMTAGPHNPSSAIQNPRIMLGLMLVAPVIVTIILVFYSVVRKRRLMLHYN